MTTATKKCPKCAENIALDAMFCSSCQTSLSATMPQPPGNCPHCLEKLSVKARFCPQCGLAVPSADKNSCPQCGSSILPGARFCELCGHLLTSPTPATPSPSVSAPLSGRISQKLRSGGTTAVVALGLISTIFMGVGFYTWQTMMPGSSQIFWWTRQIAVPQPDASKAGPLPADQTPYSPKPVLPSAREMHHPFQVGSSWEIDWQSKYRYRGILEIQEELAPNQYSARITVRYRTNRNIKKTVSMDGLMTVRGQEVIINCRNPSVSWWDTDDFYLKWQDNTLIGYNVDAKGRRGRAVFTLLEGA